MKHTLKITSLSLMMCFSGMSTMALAQVEKNALAASQILKIDGLKDMALLKGGHGGRDDDDQGRRGGDRSSDDSRDQESDGSGRRRPRTPGGSGCDDPQDIIEHPECSAGTGSGAGSGAGTAPAQSISSIEVYPSGGVEIRYTNGWKEELANGRYELKNANNRTVAVRAATAEDIARINGLAGL